MRTFVFQVILIAYPVLQVFAQPTNLEVYQQLALACLRSVPDNHPADNTTAFRLTSPPTMPYVRSALVSYWHNSDYRVYLPDTVFAVETAALPVLRYSIEDASVSYTRVRKKKGARSVTLTTSYTFSDIQRGLLADSMCTESFTDTLNLKDLNRVESDVFSETRAPHPSRRWLKRYLEPAILTAASVLGIYLFFTLRSDTNTDGT